MPNLPETQIISEKKLRINIELHRNGVTVSAYPLRPNTSREGSCDPSSDELSYVYESIEKMVKELPAFISVLKEKSGLNSDNPTKHEADLGNKKRRIINMAQPHAGSWFGLPDFGFTEKLSDLFGKPRTSQGGSNLFGSSSAPKASSSTNKTPYGPTNTGVLGASAGGSSSQGVNPQQTVSNYQTDVNAIKSGEQANVSGEIDRERSAISAEFDPIFSELDRQIGMLPEQRKQFEEQIGTLATSQRSGVETDRTKNINQLNQSGEQEKGKAKSAFQDLEEDIRNQLQARELYFGAVGAGDSSAPFVASEAVTKSGLKTRGKIINSRDDALTQIELKKADVNSLASEQSKKIDEWKSNKLFETVQFFTQKADELNQTKANAGAEKQKAINDVTRGLQRDFIGRLRQLDDSVLNFKNSVNTWQMQRTAELEDFNKRLTASAAYGGTGTKFTDQVKVFNDLLDAGYTNEQAKQIVEQRTGQFFTDPNEEENKQQGGFANLLSNIF